MRARFRRVAAIAVLALVAESSGFAAVPVVQALAPSRELKGVAPERAVSPMVNPPGLVYAPESPNGQGYQGEAEPNNSAGTASPLTGTNLVVRANLFPPGDIDFFSFTAAAGDRIYAAIMSSGSAGT
ncbi:MAG: hypothetical protein AB7P46_16210, partial [Thermoanaerobaculia bacterium]